MMTINDIDIVHQLGIYLILVLSIALHEFGHAYMADKVGDDLPRLQGRVTLNPLAHLDPIGTGLIPLLNMFGFFGGFAMIGWGKPVMVNPASHRNPMADDLLITAAGPFMNLVIALMLTFIGGFLMMVGITPPDHLIIGIYMNIALIVFNMMPIPPLDGSHFMRWALGLSQMAYIQMARYSIVMVLVLINVPIFTEFMGNLIQWGVTPLFFIMVSMAG